MAPSDQPSSAKLPIVPDMDQIFNRVSLFVSKAHSHALKSTSTPSSAASPTSAATTRGPISSLSSAAMPSTPRGTYKTAAQHAAEDADFESARNLPPNAGLGFAVPGAGGGAQAARQKREEEFALRRKLGLKGKYGAGVAAAGKRGRAEDSESEEEMGRSGVGRAKKVKVQAKGGVDAGLASKGGKEERSKRGKPEGTSEAASEALQSTRDGNADASLAPAQSKTVEEGRTHIKITAGDPSPTARQAELSEGVDIARRKRKKKKNKTQAHTAK